RTFGSRGISLSDSEVKQSAQAIQSAFEAGHSYQKIVLSFTEDYLKRMGLVDPTKTYHARGSYAGELDQMKLRTAITSGVNRLLKKGRYEN
ncbi:relaxase MobL, partial [Escherichia coli]|uniref:relaxase MobL n=1 Tax=Escherichia coli TaxID=562 RepID=UPI00211444A7